MRESARKGIVVIGKSDVKPSFAFVGVTAFTNQFEKIEDPELSFADYMVKRLKARGYPARKVIRSEKDVNLGVKAPSDGASGKVFLELRPISGSDGHFTSGVGITHRSLLGMHGPVTTYCSFRGKLVDREVKGKKPLRFKFDWTGSSGIFESRVKLGKKVTSWSQLPESDKVKLRNALQKDMQRSSEYIFKELGL